MVTTLDEPSDEDFNLPRLDHLNNDAQAMKDKVREELARTQEQHEAVMKE